MGNIFIGMSGWTFDGWRGTFYPEGLKQKDELAYASRKVQAIEVNGTFHSMFRPTAFQSWYEQTPADFVFSIKAPKYITHERRLKETQRAINNFLASGVLALKEKLGPILWQFPPTLPFLPERFEPFMASLPHDMLAAAELGKDHSDWMKDRHYLDVPVNHRMRHAIEGRHPSFKSPEFVEMARKYGIAIVVGDTAGRWPLIEDVTTDFIYLRMHGDELKYPDGYTKEALENWASRYQAWANGSQPKDAALVIPGEPPQQSRLVYAYFDNDAKETAALNAVSMTSHLQQLNVLPQRLFDEVVIVPMKKRAATKKKTPAKQLPEKMTKKKSASRRAPAKKKTRVKKKSSTTKKKRA